MNPLKLTRIIEGAHNACINWVDVKRGEEVLIITDTSCDFTNAEAVATVCAQVGANVTTVIIPMQTLPNQEPPASVAAARAEAVQPIRVHGGGEAALARKLRERRQQFPY